MEQELFADGIGDISVTGSIIRLDLVSLSATERTAENEAKPVFRQRVVMPLDGFLRSYSMMERVMTQLMKAGVVTRQEGAPPPPSAAGGGGNTVSAPTPDKLHSPNFS